jgi:hypothetical protein
VPVKRKVVSLGVLMVMTMEGRRRRRHRIGKKRRKNVSLSIEKKKRDVPCLQSLFNLIAINL